MIERGSSIAHLQRRPEGPMSARQHFRYCQEYRIGELRNLTRLRGEMQ